MRDYGATEVEHRVRLAGGRTLACLQLGDPAGPPVLYFPGEGHLSLAARRIGAALAESQSRRRRAAEHSQR
ncbi:MAG TPA: hypothetical protein VHV80_03400 [Steroidobacteraceae bacterium]|jgi:hypothetical protein|nr:hypothetical protein [Steroidobacteraceae bacterium]